MIQFLDYNEDTQDLVISFPDKGATYVYHGVPKTVADGMKFAGAFGVVEGGYFHRYVKNYPSDKL